MKILNWMVIGLLVPGMIACSSKPTKEEEPHKVKAQVQNESRPQAPWAPYRRVSFDEIFGGYLYNEIVHQKKGAVDLYINSDDDLYKQYSVAKEVGHKDRVTAVQVRAYDQIVNSKNKGLMERKFIIMTKMELGKYNNELQGFPLYARHPVGAGDVIFTYSNGHYPRRYEGKRGLPVRATASGVTKAEIALSLKGWVMPASVETAYRMLKAVSDTDREYLDVWSILLYKLEHCKLYENKRKYSRDIERSVGCRGTVEDVYAYLSKEQVRRDVLPWKVMKKVDPVVWCEKVFGKMAHFCKPKK
ncbi:MAG TPA: hypothetical protein ENI98_08320 [Gammaproteobacteria bacterium]|nr:hypothetical protein [Gammaproteobacteria bacterium]